RSGYSEIWTINVDGSDLRQLTDARSTLIAPYWSPDGSLMTAINMERRQSILFDPTKPWNTIPPIVFPSLDDAAPGRFFGASGWSPDGTQILGVELGGQGSGILVYNLGSRKYRRLPVSGFRPWWLADGRRAVY